MEKYESSVRPQSSNVLILQFYAPSTKLLNAELGHITLLTEVSWISSVGKCLYTSRLESELWEAWWKGPLSWGQNGEQNKLSALLMSMVLRSFTTYSSSFTVPPLST